MTDSDRELDPSPYLSRLQRGDFDFLDFGCSRGGSIAMAKALFSANRGLGIDVNPDKVKQALEAGHDAIVYNILALPNEPLVRFCIMSHFLEHVPDQNQVLAFLRKASAVSREFIFIRQPYFDADGYLFRHALKLYWSDWHGHPNRMTTLQFYTALRTMRESREIGNFSIHFRGPIQSSMHEAVHPITSPIDQHNYDPLKHPPKPKYVQFDYPVFSEVFVFISKAGTDHYYFFGKVKFDHTIFESTVE